MGDTIEDQVLINLVADNKNIGALRDLLQLPDIRFTDDRSGVRIGKDNSFAAKRDLLRRTGFVLDRDRRGLGFGFCFKDLRKHLGGLDLWLRTNRNVPNIAFHPFDRLPLKRKQGASDAHDEDHHARCKPCCQMQPKKDLSESCHLRSR